MDELGNRACAAHVIDQIALQACRDARYSDATRLLAATAAQRERLGRIGHRYERRRWHDGQRAIDGVLEVDALARLRSEGAAMSMQEATACARGLLASGGS